MKFLKSKRSKQIEELDREASDMHQELERLQRYQEERNRLKEEQERFKAERQKREREFAAAYNARVYGTASQVWLKSKPRIQHILKRFKVDKCYINGPSLLTKEGPIKLRVYFDWDSQDEHVLELLDHLIKLFKCPVDMNRCDYDSIMLYADDPNWQVV